MGEEKSRQIVQLWVHTYNATEKSFRLGIQTQIFKNASVHKWDHFDC